MRKPENFVKIKAELINKLKEEKAFWSYDPNSVTLESISDELLIALTLRFLDLEEINILYEIYSPKMIKEAWKKQLVPEGDYLYTLNRFLAWFYFNAKKPDIYIKTLHTKHLNKLLKS